MDRTTFALMSAACVLAGCAGLPAVSGSRSGGAAPSVTLTIHHDRKARPLLVRLARADYTIDGKAVVSLTPQNDAGQDVADDAVWTGTVRGGEHVLEAHLQYPMRAAEDMVFEVVRQYQFRSSSVGSVRIGIDEEIDQGASDLSLFRRFGVRFVLF